MKNGGEQLGGRDSICSGPSFPVQNSVQWNTDVEDRAVTAAAIFLEASGAPYVLHTQLAL